MNNVVIGAANKQWAERPADQRFGSLADLQTAVEKSRSEAVEVERPYKELQVVADGDGLSLHTPKGGASLSWWSMGQISRSVGAPAGYLRTLPAELAARNLSVGLSRLVADEPAKNANILLSRNGDLRVRAITSDKYSRIWNADVVSRLVRLEQRGPWQPAPAAFDGSRGLYASDHDLFAFLVDNERRIFEKLPGGGLSRGFFVGNSEVGAASFRITTFLYEYICGNHNIWGASNVAEIALRHVGNVDERGLRQIEATLTRYAEASAQEDEARIERAISYSLGKNKDEALDKVFGLHIPALTRGRIVAAIAQAEISPEVSSVGASPYSAWGVAQGLTRISQSEPYADERVAIDRAAGKVMELAF
jgi:hypothetical protein